jgi:membrane protein required for colicin V production
LSGLDIAFVVLAVFGAVHGYREGFLLSLFSLIGIVLGIVGGFKLMGIALVFLIDKFDIDEKLLPYIAFTIVFIVILIAVTLLGRALKASIDKSFLGRVDQAAGSLLGIVKTIFIVSILLWLSMSINFGLPAGWVDDSVLMPYLVQFAPKLTDWLGDVIPAFKDIFDVNFD